MDPFISEIRLMAYNFAPKDWAYCDGQIIAVTQNTALASLLGNRFGGNGSSTFGLPDLRQRAVVGDGAYFLNAQAYGAQEVALGITEIPDHTHQLAASSQNATTNDPTNAVPAASPKLTPYVAVPSGQQADAAFSPTAVDTTGTGAPHNNLMPTLGMKYCIALAGTYPVRP